LTSLD